MQDKEKILPERKVKSSKYFKRIYYGVLIFIFVLSVASVPFLKKYENFIENEKNVYCYFNENGTLSAITGDFYGKNIENKDDALQAVLSLYNFLNIKDDINEQLVYNNLSNNGNKSIYRFQQFYKNIQVIDGYLNLSASNNKADFLVSGFISNISDYISDKDISDAVNQVKILPEEVYPYTVFDKEIDLKVIEDYHKLVIYLNENNVPTLGKMGRISLKSGSSEWIEYDVIFDFNGQLISVNKVPDLKQTSDYLLDILNETSIFYGETAALREAAADILKTCKSKSWQLDEDLNVSEFQRTYENYIHNVKIDGLDLSYNYKSNSDNNLYENKKIIDKVMYNIFEYACKKNFDLFSGLFKTSLNYVGYATDFSDYRLAVELAAQDLGFDNKNIDLIKQCFDACKIAPSCYKVSRFNFNYEIYIKKYENKQINYNKPLVNEELKADALNKFKAFLNEKVKTKKISVFLEDLNFDGIPEMTVCDYSLWSSNDKLTTKIYMLKNGKVTKIDEYQSASASLNYNSLFFYNKNGRKYLISYNPAKIEDVGTYEYKIYYFNSDGEKVIYKSDTISFGENQKYKINDDEVKKVRDEALNYLKASELIFNTYPEAEFYNKKLNTNGLLDTEIYALENKAEGYGKSNLNDAFKKWGD